MPKPKRRKRRGAVVEANGGSSAVSFEGKMPNVIAAGFGMPVTPFWFDRVERTSIGVRQDIPHACDDVYIRNLVREVSHRDAGAIFIVGGWTWLVDGKIVAGEEGRNRLPRPPRSHTVQQARQLAFEMKKAGLQGRGMVEIGNEIDLDPAYRNNVAEFEALVMECIPAIREHGDFPIITGSVSNIDLKNDGGRGPKMLRRLCGLRFPPDTVQGIHPYRTGVEPWVFGGFDSPEHMLDWLRGVLAGRHFGITEIGWNNAEFTVKRGLFKKETKRWSQADVASFVDWELNFWKEAGSIVYGWYQIRDAPPDSADAQDAQYGAFLADGNEKLVASSLRNYRNRETT